MGRFSSFLIAGQSRRQASRLGLWRREMEFSPKL